MDDTQGQTDAMDANILLVQRASIGDDLEQKLSAAGIEAIRVSSIREAREAMRAIVFPVVLIDEAHGDDALTLIGELRRRYERHRVHLTLLVDAASPSHLERALLAGADDSLDRQLAADEWVKHIRMAAARVQLNVR